MKYGDDPAAGYVEHVLIAHPCFCLHGATLTAPVTHPRLIPKQRPGLSTCDGKGSSSRLLQSNAALISPHACARLCGCPCAVLTQCGVVEREVSQVSGVLRQDEQPTGVAVPH